MNAQAITQAPRARHIQSDFPTKHPVSALPFVRSRGNRIVNKWDVTPTNDYVNACDAGREFAAHYVQHIKDNGPGNLLAMIAADINFKDETGAKGYWVGFFTHLERLLFSQAQRMDVFGDLQMLQAVYADMLAKHNFNAEEV